MRNTPIKRLLLMAGILLLPGAAPQGQEAIVTELADALWARQLESSIVQRLREGLPITHFQDISLAQAQAQAAFAAKMLERLDKVDTKALPDKALVTSLTLREALRSSLEAPANYIPTFSIDPRGANPAFGNMHQALARQQLDQPSGRENYLRLMDEYRDHLDQHVAKLTLQEQQGYRLSRPVIETTRLMLSDLEKTLSANLAPKPERLQAVSAPEAEAFQRAVQQRIGERIEPSLRRLQALLGEEYWRRAPQDPGVAHLPGGRAFYARRARTLTTMDMSPEEIHALGLRRVAELSKRVQESGRRLGFTGSVEEIFDQAAKDRRFFVTKEEEIEPLMMAQMRAVEPFMPRYFHKIPNVPYGVRRIDPASERVFAYGNYTLVNEGGQKGYYNHNASDLENRSYLTVRAMMLHELLPGHHLQITSASGAADVHPALRTVNFGAYTEGWGEYAAHLGYEMGLYDDPGHELGKVANEMFFAVRLVVDTGIGHYGWSLEKARQYMRQHLYQGESEIESESIRYATNPGQALGYRLGMERILALRSQAERELGPKFDIRDFHQVVLGAGAMPLVALEERVKRYIAATRAGRAKKTAVAVR